MKIIHYSEFTTMIDCKPFLDGVLRAINGTGTDLDSNYVVIDDEIFKIVP